MRRCYHLAAFLLVCLLAAAAPHGTSKRSYRDWRVYAGGWDGIRYSTLDQINRNNVGNLKVAWSYDSGDSFEGSELQCNPLIIDGVLYGTTPALRLIALDAATGKLRWSFDPHDGQKYSRKSRNRGVNHWTDGKDSRIYYAFQHWLYAIDTKTGKPAAQFGTGGRVDLRAAFDRDPDSLNISVSTPGAVYQDLLILGSITAEDLPAAPGDIRAYDVRTGKLRWKFHTIPRPGEFGYDTWPADGWKRSGGANSWAGVALDEARGLVFVPTGSAAFDFYGGDRPGDNLFANCLLALKAGTGERVWHFQFVKHDVWDRDLPSAPSLVTLHHGGRRIDAVAQITKSGEVFVFERETGKPVFPIEYRKVPPSNIPGEKLAEAQPFTLKPPPFARQRVTEEILTRRTPEAHRAVLERFRKLRSEGQFAPPSAQGSIIFPGLDGGGEWGGAAFDPETGLLYVNANEMAWILGVRPRKDARKSGTAKALYASQCANCHRADLRGTPPEFPSLVDIGARRSQSQVETVIRKGAGRMPGFARLGDDAISAITAFLIRGEDKEVVTAKPVPGDAVAYTHEGYNKFLDPDGYPAIAPPWGTLNAIDLNKGEIRWSIPFGEIPALVEKGMRNTGSENYGGPVVTTGGLLFIGATNHDRKFRAYDKRNGEVLWETTLPAAGNATPAIYEVNGKQFVVIAAGGGKWGLPSSATWVAFSLP